jgi:hypothetical protein
MDVARRTDLERLALQGEDRVSAHQLGGLPWRAQEGAVTCCNALCFRIHPVARWNGRERFQQNRISSPPRAGLARPAPRGHGE